MQDKEAENPTAANIAESTEGASVKGQSEGQSSAFNGIRVPAFFCCYAGTDQPCVCPPRERVIRYAVDGHLALTPEQRAELVDEITNVEGYEENDATGLSDPDLARLTLHAWADYVCDKGLL